MSMLHRRDVSRSISPIFRCGALVWLALDSPWLLPAMFVHGVVLVHHFSLQHECTHYTAFRTRRLNDVVGAACGFVIMLAPRFFRYEHCDHQTWTQLEGRDPELIPLPKSLWGTSPTSRRVLTGGRRSRRSPATPSVA